MTSLDNKIWRPTCIAPELCFMYVIVSKQLFCSKLWAATIQKVRSQFASLLAFSFKKRKRDKCAFYKHCQSRLARTTYTSKKPLHQQHTESMLLTFRRHNRCAPCHNLVTLGGLRSMLDCVNYWLPYLSSPSTSSYNVVPTFPSRNFMHVVIPALRYILRVYLRQSYTNERLHYLDTRQVGHSHTTRSWLGLTKSVEICRHTNLFSHYSKTYLLVYLYLNRPLQ